MMTYTTCLPSQQRKQPVAKRLLVNAVSKTLSPLILVLSLITTALPYHSMAAEMPTILIYGDSLSAGFGLLQGEEWPALMHEQAQQEGAHFKLVNASISGETTSGGLSRLPAILNKHQPDFMVLELGANDGLRGQSLKEMRSNLSAMITLSQKNNASVLLIGMKIPPNYGKRYSQDFEQSFMTLSQNHKVNFVPFILENIAGKPDLNLTDGIHPNKEAQQLVLDNIWPSLKPMILEFQSSNTAQ